VYGFDPGYQSVAADLTKDGMVEDADRQTAQTPNQWKCEKTYHREGGGFFKEKVKESSNQSMTV
jgi:hypothetical protein